MNLRLLLSAALCSVTLAAQADTVLEIPQIGEPADTSLSPAEERALGAEIVSQFYANDYVLEDPEVAQYVGDLMQRVISGQDGRTPVTVFAVKDDRINAFALPGGFIGINAGTLVAAQTESELASVLAHELAHVTQRHIARAANDTSVASIATWAAVIAAIVAGSADPDIVLAAISAGQAINYQRQVNYTRAHELEADRIGIRTLASAGFDAEGMASFFTRLEQQSRLYGNGIPEFLRTHPINTTRISEARTRIAALPKRTGADSPDFAFIQARTRVLAADAPSQALEYFSSQLPTRATTLYGLAMAQTLGSDYVRAEATLARIRGDEARQLNVSLLRAQIQLGRGNSAAALASFKSAQDANPRSSAALFAYADALLEANRPEEARRLLLTRAGLAPRADVFRRLASAARDAGQLTEAQFQTANFLVERGDAGGALGALDVALRSASLSAADRSRLQARRDEIRALLPKDWRPKRERIG